MAGLTLILGGARSGKSRHAEQLAGQRSSVLYVATGQALDEEMAARIAAHQAGRPASWRTLEAPTQVAAAIAGSPGRFEVVLLDCITLLANNLFAGSDTEDPTALQSAEAALMVEIEALLDTRRDSAADWIVVSNELGLGLVPPNPLGRAYRDALGRANQRLAQAADRVLLMVAGLPMALKGGPD